MNGANPETEFRPDESELKEAQPEKEPYEPNPEITQMLSEVDDIMSSLEEALESGDEHAVEAAMHGHHPSTPLESNVHAYERMVEILNGSKNLLKESLEMFDPWPKKDNWLDSDEPINQERQRRLAFFDTYYHPRYNRARAINRKIYGAEDVPLRFII